MLLTNNLKTFDVTSNLPDDSVTPRNQAIPATIAFVPPIGEITEAGVATGAHSGTTTTGNIALELKFGEPVSGVTMDNLRIQSTGNVTCVIAAPDAQPTDTWVLLCKVTPADATVTADVFLDNSAGIVPPPAQTADKLFTVVFDQVSGQEDPGSLTRSPESRSSFKWWAILLILAALIGVVIAGALYAANKTGQVQHTPGGKPPAAAPTAAAPGVAPHSMA